MQTPVSIPLLNPNEPDSLVAALHVKEGQWIAAGDMLATFETTKSTLDLFSEHEGYVIGLHLAAGETAHAGDLLCYITDDPSWCPSELDPSNKQTSKLGEGILTPPEDLRITHPALALARQFGFDMSKLPKDKLITESLVRSMLSAPSGIEDRIATDDEGDLPAILIFGGGGHGKALIDLLRLLNIDSSEKGYQIAGIIDDGLSAGETIMGIPVLGGSEKLAELRAQGVHLAVNAVGGIGNINTRILVFQRLIQAGFSFPQVIHPAAHVENSTNLSAGVQVFARAYVGSEAKLGFGVIVNTGAIISHDCILEEFANISPGALLAGEVQVGTACLIGMGATINLKVKVGAGSRIGNGATVKEDVPAKTIIRAGSIWP